MDFSVIDWLITIAIIAAMIIYLILIWAKFAPFVSRSVDKMAITAYVKRNKIKNRDDFISFYRAKKEKNPINEYLFQQSMEHYDKYINTTSHTE